MSAQRSSLGERSGFQQREIASLDGGVSLYAVYLIAIPEGYGRKFRKGGRDRQSGVREVAIAVRAIMLTVTAKEEVLWVENGCSRSCL
jgi:hypothetical protein